jgi:hypothetical protein
MSDPTKVRIIGTIASLRVMDVSKRAGVENLKSYVELDVETVDPPTLGDRLAGRARLVKDGTLEHEVGSRVEIETLSEAAGVSPLPIHRITQA